MANEVDQTVHNLLVAWLDRDDWRAEELIRWLQYFDFPPVGHDEEPYKWLLRGLRPQEGALRAEFAQRVAAVLEARPDVKRPGKRPEQVLYNLLLLSAGLKQPRRLAEPLRAMLERGKLDGHWQGVQLRSCLREALTENQTDGSLLPIWRAMLYKRGHKFLKGNKFDGYRGIINMPVTDDSLRAPDLEEIGKALREIADHLKGDDDIRPELRYLIKMAMDRHPEHRGWDLDLLRQADKHRWPPVAVECLPSLYIPLKGEHAGLRRFILWNHIYSLVEHTDGCVVEKELCRGHGYLAQLPQMAVRIVSQVAPRLEEARLNNPFPTIESGKKVVINVMAEIESEIKEADPEVAKTVDDERQRALAEVLD